MRLSELESELLVATQLSPLSTVEELTKRLRAPAHRIQYALQKINGSTITRSSVLIDYRALGLEQYELYFSLASQPAQTKKKTLTKLFHHEKVFWYAELGGTHPYGISFIAPSTHEASNFLETLSTQEESLFSSKEVAAIISFTLFEKTYLLPSPTRTTNRKSLTIGRKASKATKVFSTIDETDSKIIKALLADSSISKPKLATQLSIPRATVEYRIARLFSEGICLAPVKFISAAKLGYQVFKLLITTRGVLPSLSESLYKFCLNEPHVTTLIHSLGAWDYEIVIEVSSARQVSLFIERLNEQFEKQITSIETLPVFEQGVSSQFSV